MNERPFSDEEAVLVLTTRQPLPRWLRVTLQALGVLTVVTLLVAVGIGWRYVSVQQRVKNDLAIVIGDEEDIRAMGGVNAAHDFMLSSAPNAWRYRYLSSVQARQGRPLPTLALESVQYDGFTARVQLMVDGVLQFRQYELAQGKWVRAPFLATGWGEKKEIVLPDGITIIYWQQDEDFANTLAEDIPKLLVLMQALGLSPAAEAHRLVIIPNEFGDLVRPAEKITGVVLNSPHVDWIPQTPGYLSAEDDIRLHLARKMFADARKAAASTSSLPGAVRIYRAIDEVLAWQWALGNVNQAAVSNWAAQLKGEWVSPTTGLPPDLITKLQPDAPDAAARLMMTYLLRKTGVETLVALNTAMASAQSWDEAYDQAVQKSAWQVEEAARRMAKHPQAPAPDWPDLQSMDIPDAVTYLGRSAAESNMLLARTPSGQAIALHIPLHTRFTLADGAPLSLDCIAPGSELRISGAWIDQGLQVQVDEISLSQAVLPPVLQTPPLSTTAWAIVSRQQPGSNKPLVRLSQLFPGNVESTLTEVSQQPVWITQQQAPIFVWMTKSACNRNWVIRYEPAKGVTGAWLAPTGMIEVQTAVSAAEDHGLYLQLLDKTGELHAFQTAPPHLLVPLDKEAWQQATKTQPMILQATEQALTAIDTTTGEQHLLYKADDAESVLSVISVIGDVADQWAFIVRYGDRNQVLATSARAPDAIKPLLSFDSQAKLIPPLVYCPDGALLYGLQIQNAAGEEESALHLRMPNGDDRVLIKDQGRLQPLFCAAPPTALPTSIRYMPRSS